MYRSDGVHGLQFNDYQVFDEEVNAISEIKFHALIHDWKSDLGRRLNAGCIEFNRRYAV